MLRIVAGFAIVLGSGVLTCACGPAASDPRTAPDEGRSVRPVEFAAPGRIEGATEVVEVGTSIDGVLSEVLVTEGQRVKTGEVLARLECDDLVSRSAAALSNSIFSDASSIAALNSLRYSGLFPSRNAHASSTRSK